MSVSGTILSIRAVNHHLSGSDLTSLNFRSLKYFVLLAKKKFIEEINVFQFSHLVEHRHQSRNHHCRHSPHYHPHHRPPLHG